MKYSLSLIGALVTVAGCLLACQQSNYSEFSHHILVRNDGGDVIAIAQIALPPATSSEVDSLIVKSMPGSWQFSGQWMLESWKDEFPRKGAPGQDYRATRRGDILRVDLNPLWYHNNFVLIGKQVGPRYEGNWYYQVRGVAGMGTFEIVPISGPNAGLVTLTERVSPVRPDVAQPIISPDLPRNAAQGR